MFISDRVIYIIDNLTKPVVSEANWKWGGGARLKNLEKSMQNDHHFNNYSFISLNNLIFYLIEWSTCMSYLYKFGHNCYSGIDYDACAVVGPCWIQFRNKQPCSVSGTISISFGYKKKILSVQNTCPENLPNGIMHKLLPLCSCTRVL